MKKIIFGWLIILSFAAQAQFTKASLQASGLTCSMCSKAVKNALEKVPFVAKVLVDIKNQQYNLQFKEGEKVDFDALGRAVEDAGFSVASLKATAKVDRMQLQKDEHLKIGESNFHFLNSNGQWLAGDLTVSFVDKSFVSAKAFKKYAALTKMPCVQTGKMAQCCTKNDAVTTSEQRIYHVIL